MAKPPEPMLRNAGAGAIHQLLLAVLVVALAGALAIGVGLATGVLVPR